MNKGDDLSEFRCVAKETLRAQDKLLEAWEKLHRSAHTPASTPEDVELLKELIVQRIYPVHVFSLLVKMDLLAAISMLIRRYVGKGADPDRKFGGYEYELSCMLVDLCEAHGEAALRNLIRVSDFNIALLKDGRVIRSFAEALEIEDGEFERWVKG